MRARVWDNDIERGYGVGWPWDMNRCRKKEGYEEVPKEIIAICTLLDVG
jgi:hypothetical protein